MERKFDRVKWRPTISSSLGLDISHVIVQTSPFIYFGRSRRRAGFVPYTKHWQYAKDAFQKITGADFERQKLILLLKFFVLVYRGVAQRWYVQ